MSSTGAVKGSESHYICARPYQSTTTIGVTVANSRMTTDEKNKMYQIRVEEWLSSPGHPLATYTARQDKDREVPREL
ncbi:hypothetical protein V493_03387 [Pseudogymnoascus sp. VKM F-4281 (FW-2241)]|nr:hypothetical protein V493_03387 [Pseudogymnoascus sp. VKM F-4281 (FW-2241)]